MDSTISTASASIEPTTLPQEEDSIKRKNDKVLSIGCTRMHGWWDSSLSFEWGDVNEYLSCDLNSLRRASPPSADYWISFLASSAPFEQATEKIIESYKIMLDINALFVKEYTPLSSIDAFHSLVGIGDELFSDARPRNEYESKRIDDFIRSKAKTISSKPL